MTYDNFATAGNLLSAADASRICISRAFIEDTIEFERLVWQRVIDRLSEAFRYNVYGCRYSFTLNQKSGGCVYCGGICEGLFNGQTDQISAVGHDSKS